MARCIDDNVQGSTVAERETCNLGAQIHANMRVIASCSGVFGLAADGIRIGQPAEETWYQVLFHPQSDRSFILPPMVP